MSKLIALVATAVVIDGKRTVIQPGEPLPELSKHDARELKDSGAARDEADEAARAKEDEKAVRAAEADFAAARKRVEDEQAAAAAGAPKPKTAIPKK